MRIIYLIFCKIYNFFFSIYQNLLFKKKDEIKISQLINTGYELIFFENNLNKLYKSERKLKVNSYIYKDILSKESIEEIIYYIFQEKKIAEKIFLKTGFCYSVDFLIGYETLYIPSIESSKEWYANQWHNDKPFTKHTLKLIIPLNFENNYQSGGIEIMDIKQSILYGNNNKIPNIEDIFIMKNKFDELLIFNPNLCYHKAGNPESSTKRKQLMIQLNPSNKWKINENLYKKQMKIEPKFPFFNYLFDKKRILNL